MTKITAEQCLDHLINVITERPELINNLVSFVGKEQVDKWKNELWPACLDRTMWYRTATLRPSQTDKTGFYGGTDKEVRVYENEAWYPKLLKAVVTSEFGSIIDVKITLT